MALNEARARRAEDLLGGVLQSYLDRSRGVVLARAGGPKARRGTKWWTPTPGSAPAETKALDAGYVVPDKLGDGLADDVRAVTLEIAVDSAKDTARRLGEPHPDDLSAYDNDQIERAVEEAIAVILGVADRHARELRAAVLDADTDADSLDDLLDRIEQAHRRGGAWVLMAGRTLANALANAAAYDQALRLGCTHAQWVSRRDDRVRPTHVTADGQVRRMGVDFTVGKFRLRHPGDPKDLPSSWEQVAGCRCGLIFRRPDENARKLFEVVDRIVRDGGAPRLATAMLDRAALAALALPDGGTITPTPQGYGLPPAAPVIELAEPVVAYRQLDAPVDVVPGQRISGDAVRVLGLAPPERSTALTLAVLVPAGVAVAYASGAIVLPEGALLDVLGVGATGIRAQVVEATP